MTTAEKQTMKPVSNRLLLLEDIRQLGRKGEVVTVKRGFARNFLVPQKKAVIADTNTLRMQAKLKEERAKQAAIDLEVSTQLTGQIHGMTFNTHVKVDPFNNMYGSVTSSDIVDILATQGLVIEKEFVLLGQAIRAIGLHDINLMLKEEVTCRFKLKVIPEGMDDLPEAPQPVAEAAVVVEAEEETEGDVTESEESE